VERLYWRQAFVDMCSIFFAMDGGFLLNDNVIIFLFKIRASSISLVDFVGDSSRPDGSLTGTGPTLMLLSATAYHGCACSCQRDNCPSNTCDGLKSCFWSQTNNVLHSGYHLKIRPRCLLHCSEHLVRSYPIWTFCCRFSELAFGRSARPSNSLTFPSVSSQAATSHRLFNPPVLSANEAIQTLRDLHARCQCWYQALLFKRIDFPSAEISSVGLLSLFVSSHLLESLT
jgi:hypothetical protein